MSGFFAVDADAWPVIAAMLPLPWPEEAAATDLRWFADRARMGKGERLGRPALAARWGWTEWAVRELVRSGSWEDRWTATGQNEQRFTSSTPADRQRAASRGKGERRESAENRQRDASAPPENRPTRADHTHPSPSTQEGVDLAPPVPVVAPAPDLPSVLKGDTTLTAPLAAAGITTLDALTAQTPTAVQMLNRVGPKRLAAIVAHLAEAGLTLRAEPSRARKADIDRPGLRDLTDRWAGAYEHVTGRPYVWTPGGRRSDNKAARELYDALGWSAEPSEATVQRVRGVVIRYLRTRTTPGSHRVPTLADLAACLDQFAQDDHVVASAHKPRPVQVTKADQEREMLGGLETLFREARGVIATS